MNSPDLVKVDLRSFAGALAEAVLRGHQQFAFFLGAGCSISSGVLPASTLCLQWIRELKRQHDRAFSHKPRQFSDLEFVKWYQTIDSTFDEGRAGEFYSSIMKKRFPNAALRRMATQRFVTGADPGVGYQLLAALLLDSKAGPSANVVLTTNFDDLVYDTLTLFYRTRPLVIAHDDIAKRAIPPIGSPMVFKLHGDALLEPLNTPEETQKLAANVAASMSAILMGRGVIFLGYSGGDESIASALENLPPESLRNGVYWVNERLPTNPAMMAWLIKRGAVWVKHTDFDTAMMALSLSFKVAEPSTIRFRSLIDDVKEAKGAVERRLQGPRRGSKPTKSLDKVKSLLRKPPPKSPEEICKIMQNAIDENPKDAFVRGYYAHHLSGRGKYAEAYEAYMRALEIDPDNVQNLLHLASFLVDHDVRSEDFDLRLDKAERLLRRACNIESRNPRALGSLASFLWTRRLDKDAADAFFQRALQADPENTETMASYGNFIWRAHGLLEEATEYYNEAIAKNPDNMRMLANFSQLLFLTNENGRARRYAKAVLERAKSRILQLEATFYLYVFDDEAGREAYLPKLKSLIEAGVRSPGWDLEESVRYAEQSGKGSLLIETLSNVISNGLPAEKLSQLVDWNKP
ncbi:SIR2 family protein [Bradyrhizobium sp. Arg237L]|uniref:SIR2 family protein n=1 Tax=Bradyrhizobium sp. Arg237L TaxID=3003352 RepID=UPI00249E4BF5|nr:SIR2 family protein [Bradyrhizobium sp. Arg237L]MDI4232497.1 SIR2 family protein [Bradyrhizobium sp. Arg237L]